MRREFDRRIMSEAALAFVRECQKRAPCHLGGGAALAGAYLGHRVTGDIDIFIHDPTEMRDLVRLLPEVAAAAGAEISILRDVGSLVRARIVYPNGESEVDVVHDQVADVQPPVAVEGVKVESLADLRASKLTCILSRSEPRDLVDLLFLDSHGYPPEKDLHLALRKDAGFDPGVISWLLSQFPTQPMPTMIEPLTHAKLESFRKNLAERMRKAAIGQPDRER